MILGISLLLLSLLPSGSAKLSTRYQYAQNPGSATQWSVNQRRKYHGTLSPQQQSQNPAARPYYENVLTDPAAYNAAQAAAPSAEFPNALLPPTMSTCDGSASLASFVNLQNSMNQKWTTAVQTAAVNFNVTVNGSLPVVTVPDMGGSSLRGAFPPYPDCTACSPGYTLANGECIQCAAPIAQTTLFDATTEDWTTWLEAAAQDAVLIIVIGAIATVGILLLVWCVQSTRKGGFMIGLWRTADAVVTINIALQIIDRISGHILAPLPPFQWLLNQFLSLITFSRQRGSNCNPSTFLLSDGVSFLILYALFLLLFLHWRIEICVNRRRRNKDYKKQQAMLPQGARAAQADAEGQDDDDVDEEEEEEEDEVDEEGRPLRKGCCGRKKARAEASAVSGGVGGSSGGGGCCGKKSKSAEQSQAASASKSLTEADTVGGGLSTVRRRTCCCNGCCGRCCHSTWKSIPAFILIILFVAYGLIMETSLNLLNCRPVSANVSVYKMLLYELWTPGVVVPASWYGSSQAWDQILSEGPIGSGGSATVALVSSLTAANLSSMATTAVADAYISSGNASVISIPPLPSLGVLLPAPDNSSATQSFYVLASRPTLICFQNTTLVLQVVAIVTIVLFGLAFPIAISLLLRKYIKKRMLETNPVVAQIFTRTLYLDAERQQQFIYNQGVWSCPRRIRWLRVKCCGIGKDFVAEPQFQASLQSRHAAAKAWYLWRYEQAKQRDKKRAIKQRQAEFALRQKLREKEEREASIAAAEQRRKEQALAAMKERMQARKKVQEQPREGHRDEETGEEEGGAADDGAGEATASKRKCCACCCRGPKKAATTAPQLEDASANSSSTPASSSESASLSSTGATVGSTVLGSSAASDVTASAFKSKSRLFSDSAAISVAEAAGVPSASRMQDELTRYGIYVNPAIAAALKQQEMKQIKLAQERQKRRNKAQAAAAASAAASARKAAEEAEEEELKKKCCGRFRLCCRRCCCSCCKKSGGANYRVGDEESQADDEPALPRSALPCGLRWCCRCCTCYGSLKFEPNVRSPSCCSSCCCCCCGGRSTTARPLLAIGTPEHALAAVSKKGAGGGGGVADAAAGFTSASSEIASTVVSTTAMLATTSRRRGHNDDGLDASASQQGHHHHHHHHHGDSKQHRSKSHRRNSNGGHGTSAAEAAAAGGTLSAPSRRLSDSHTIPADVANSLAMAGYRHKDLSKMLRKPEPLTTSDSAFVITAEQLVDAALLRPKPELCYSTSVLRITALLSEPVPGTNGKVSSVRVPPTIRAFAGVDYRPSAAYFRALELLLLLVVTICSIFGQPYNGMVVFIGRTCIIVLCMFLFAWAVCEHQPFVTSVGWKAATRVTALVVALLAEATNCMVVLYLVYSANGNPAVLYTLAQGISTGENVPLWILITSWLSVASGLLLGVFIIISFVFNLLEKEDPAELLPLLIADFKRQHPHDYANSNAHTGNNAGSLENGSAAAAAAETKASALTAVVVSSRRNSAAGAEEAEADKDKGKEESKAKDKEATGAVASSSPEGSKAPAAAEESKAAKAPEALAAAEVNVDAKSQPLAPSEALAGVAGGAFARRAAMAAAPAPAPTPAPLLASPVQEGEEDDDDDDDEESGLSSVATIIPALTKTDEKKAEAQVKDWDDNEDDDEEGGEDEGEEEGDEEEGRDEQDDNENQSSDDDDDDGNDGANNSWAANSPRRLGIGPSPGFGRSAKV